MKIKKRIVIIISIMCVFLSSINVYAVEKTNSLSVINVTSKQQNQNSALVWVGNEDKSMAATLVINNNNGKTDNVNSNSSNCPVDYVVFFDFKSKDSYNRLQSKYFERLKSIGFVKDSISFMNYDENINNKYSKLKTFDSKELITDLKNSNQNTDNKNCKDYLSSKQVFNNNSGESRVVFLIRLTDDSSITVVPHRETINSDVLMEDVQIDNFASNKIASDGRGIKLLDFQYNLSEAKSVQIQYGNGISDVYEIQSKKSNDKQTIKDSSKKNSNGSIAKDKNKKSHSSILEKVLLVIFLGIIAAALGVLVYLYRKDKERFSIEKIINIQKLKNLRNFKFKNKLLNSKSKNKPNNKGLSFGSVQNIGKRNSQQDSFGISDFEDKKLLKEKGVLVIVADGMGGLEYGRESSHLVVSSMMEQFNNQSNNPSIPKELKNMIFNSNVELLNYLASLGGNVKSGSTAAAVIIKGSDLYWISVGDSRILLYRQNKLFNLNREHTYGTQLFQEAIEGKISIEEALINSDSKSLTSYMGIIELTEIDQNIKPFKLISGDKIILCSRGVYGSLSDDEIIEAVSLEPQLAAVELEKKIVEKELINQDNFTAIVIGCN